MKLKDLLKNVEFVEIIGEQDLDITNIAYDSRRVEKGSLFICITGFSQDGHLYAENAAEKGATVILAEKPIAVDNVTVVIVDNTRAVMAQIAVNFYKDPTNEVRVIGITGTNGKTTTTYLIKSILEQNNKKTGLLGTISTQIGDKEYKSSRTTPESLDLQKIFRDMADARIEYCVMEVSSHSLELDRVRGCKFKIGIFTNLTQDHLDFHKTIESYRNAKTKLFYNTSEMNIINIDDEHGRIIAAEIANQKTKLLTYAIDIKADIMAKNIKISAKGVEFTLVTPKYSIDIVSNIPGKFSVYNCLAAAAAAYADGISADIIAIGIAKLKTVPGRSEVVETNKPFSVLIDYAHTPDGLLNILKTIKEYAPRRIITLFGCGGNRDKEKRPQMGKIAGDYSDFCIITSDNPRKELPMDIIDQIEKGIKLTKCDYICIENRQEAILYALKIAQADDIILLAGKGHETYQEFADHTIPFDEKEIVCQLLKEI